MPMHKFLHLHEFVSFPIEVFIQDAEGGRHTNPSFERKLEKIQICPDQTHLRLYFDHMHFMAVPLNGQITAGLDEFQVYDEKNGLHYHIRKGKKSCSKSTSSLCKPQI